MENKSTARWPVLVALTLLAVVTVGFVVLFVVTSVNQEPPATTPQHNIEQVNELLANADPARGEALIVQFDCYACHVAAADVGIAPPFDGVAERAATRRPPLTAPEYLYESITNPTAYVVEGYTGSMPENFSERLSAQQLGDIMAYLLTLN